MKAVFFDIDKERMERNYEFFTQKKNLVFIPVNTMENFIEADAAADVAIVYYSDFMTEEFMEVKYIGRAKYIYLICGESTPSSYLLGFFLKAECVEGIYEKEKLYELMRNEIENIGNTNTSKYIEKLMRVCRIPVHLTGRTYLKTAVEMCCANAEMLSGITKILYPSISKYYSVSSCSVERALRIVIDKSWSKDNEGYTQILNIGIHKKPTNKEFIAAAVNYVENQK